MLPCLLALSLILFFVFLSQLVLFIYLTLLKIVMALMNLLAFFNTFCFIYIFNISNYLSLLYKPESIFIAKKLSQKIILLNI